MSRETVNDYEIENGQQVTNRGSAKRVIFLIIFVLAVALAFSVPLLKKLEDAIDNNPEPGYMTFNASRYFFRVDCPETYIVNKEPNGFLLNRETGLVAEIKPSHVETSEDQLAHLDDETGIKVSFFYKASKDTGLAELTLSSVTSYFCRQLKTGLLGEDLTGFAFSDVDIINVGNQNNDLYARDFTLNTGENKYKGTVYCAARPAAVYLICVMYEDGDVYSEYAEEITEMIKTFRLTVLKE